MEAIFHSNGRVVLRFAKKNSPSDIRPSKLKNRSVLEHLEESPPGCRFLCQSVSRVSACCFGRLQVTRFFRYSCDRRIICRCHLEMHICLPSHHTIRPKPRVLWGPIVWSAYPEGVQWANDRTSRDETSAKPTSINQILIRQMWTLGQPAGDVYAKQGTIFFLRKLNKKFYTILWRRDLETRDNWFLSVIIGMFSCFFGWLLSKRFVCFSNNISILSTRILSLLLKF